MPQPRSLLTSERGLVTLRLMAPAGGAPIDGIKSLTEALENIARKAKATLPSLRGGGLGRIKPVTDGESGMAGVAFDVTSEIAPLVRRGVVGVVLMRCARVSYG